jgi:hypothetical protein
MVRSGRSKPSSGKLFVIVCRSSRRNGPMHVSVGSSGRGVSRGAPSGPRLWRAPATLWLAVHEGPRGARSAARFTERRHAEWHAFSTGRPCGACGRAAAILCCSRSAARNWGPPMPWSSPSACHRQSRKAAMKARRPTDRPADVPVGRPSPTTCPTSWSSSRWPSALPPPSLRATRASAAKPSVRTTMTRGRDHGLPARPASIAR